MEITLFVHSVFLLTVTLVKHVVSQCSEAHNTACSMQISRLKSFDDVLYPVGGFLPDYNETTLQDICQIFQDYKNCSLPHFINCDQQTMTELHILDSALSPVCNQLLSDYVKHRLCFQRLKNIYLNCQQQRDEKLKTQEPDDTHYKLHMCTVTNEYVSCSYTVTAVMCSLEAADLYYDIVNSSISSLLSTTGFACSIRHPSDVIKVITTTTSTTTVTSEVHTTKEPTTSVLGTIKPVGKTSTLEVKYLTIFFMVIFSHWIIIFISLF